MVTAGSDRKKIITAALILVALVFAKIMLRPFGALDELWVYNLSRGVAMGYLPYRDVAMETMPLYYLVFSLPLLLYRSLFVYRIATALMFSALAISFYRISTKMTDHLRGLLASSVFVALMDYSTYNGLMVLLMFFVFILFGRLNTRNAVIAGVLSGFALLCRQTSGVLFVIAVLCFMWFYKSFRKYILPFLIGWTVIMCMFAVYLLATDSFAAFWDCCLFALIGSNETNSIFLADGITAGVIATAGVAASIYLIRKNHSKDDVLHLVFGLVLLTIAVPIVDLMHMLYSAAWFLIPILKLVDNKVSGSFLKITIAAVSAVGLFLGVFELPQTCLDNRYRELWMIPVRSSEIEYYEQLISFNSRFVDEGKHVVILTSGRCIISIMTDSFDTVYDNYFIANKGTRGPMSFIEEDMENPDVMFLIPDDYEEENWTNPRGVLSYIQSECEPVERYDAFVWYAPG